MSVEARVCERPTAQMAAGRAARGTQPWEPPIRIAALACSTLRHGSDLVIPDTHSNTMCVRALLHMRSLSYRLRRDHHCVDVMEETDPAEKATDTRDVSKDDLCTDRDLGVRKEGVRGQRTTGPGHPGGRMAP